MGVPITNASSVLLSQNTGTLPYVGDAMLDYFQPMLFDVVTKTTVLGVVNETKVVTTFQGVWQPLSPQALQMKPEGQRAWTWFRVHADPSLALSPDDVIVYQGIQYRVMARYDYKIYGYNEFHLVQDYTNSGPA